MPAPRASAESCPAPNRWWTRRALVAHVVLAAWVPGCVAATWWQVGIARAGDGLGWIYAVMWPCFAVFGTVFWWYLVHDDPDTVGARGLRRLRAASAEAGAEAASDPSRADVVITRAEAEDPELAAYNAYLARLAQQPKTWRPR